MITRTLLAAACAATFTSGAFAASPYSLPYGLQWSYGSGDSDTGNGNHNANALDLAVSSDGTVWSLDSGSSVANYGVGSTGSINGNVGAISASGQLLFGTTTRDLPGMTSPGQNYAAGVSVIGNKAYFATYGAQNQYWSNLEDPNNPGNFISEDGKDGNRPMVWSLDASGLSSIADQRSLSLYADNSGTLRTDPFVPTTTGLSPVAGQNRLQDSTIGTSGKMVMVMDMVAGDFATAGDYEGYNLRNGGTADAYLPGIGVYDFNTNTLSGPAKQPVVQGGSSNFATYFHSEIDNASGRYYGSGSAHTRNESTSTEWDPDGSGSASVITFANSNSAATAAGIGTAYDANNNLLFAVTWDSASADSINTIAASNDGTNASFWGGTNNGGAYLEKRDASGAVVWSDTVASGTVVQEITVDADGDVWISGTIQTTPGDTTTEDSFIRKYTETAPNTYTEVWTRVVNFGTSTTGDGTREVLVDHAFDSKNEIYILTRNYTQWDTINGFTKLTPDNFHDQLVQKLVPGDFSGDGIVDFAEVQTVDAATAVSSAVDTYDFDEDGDSDFMDVTYFYLTILDNLPGDTDGDGDIDDADLGTSFSSYTGPTGMAGGRNALDGDTDGDGDVDDADLGASFSAYTGPLGPAVPEPASLALLGLGGLLIARRRRA